MWRPRASALSAIATNAFVRRSFANTGAGSPLRIGLIGAPGAGKGTQSAKLEVDYNLTTISTGHLLRQLVKEASSNPLAQQVQQQMQGGGLVSDEIMLGIIREELSRLKQLHKGWVLDGYPRTVRQAEQLDVLLNNVDHPLQKVLYLSVSEQVLWERIQDRWVHAPSGRVYNISYKPPKVAGKDDVTGEPLVRREDDTLETIRARLAAFHRATLPVLEYYGRNGRLVEIDSPTSAVGYEAIRKLLGPKQQA